MASQSQPAKPVKVAFSSITNGRDTSSIVNAISAVKMQMAIMTHPVQLEYRFDGTLSDAIDYFYNNKEFDVLVAVDSYYGFSENWVIENVVRQKDKRVITGIAPIPGKIDWERIKAKAGDEREPNASKGFVYNVDITKAEISDDGEYAIVDRADLACLILKRGPLEALGAVHPELVYGGGIMAHAPSVKDGVRRSADETLCDRLKELKVPLYADIERPLTSFGNQVFCGCCGIRKQLR